MKQVLISFLAFIVGVLAFIFGASVVGYFITKYTNFNDIVFAIITLIAATQMAFRCYMYTMIKCGYFN